MFQFSDSYKKIKIKRNKDKQRFESENTERESGHTEHAGHDAGLRNARVRGEAWRGGAPG